MAESQTLKAEAREKGSKGAVRSLRRQGRVPAVIYGDKKSPELITVLNPQGELGDQSKRLETERSSAVRRMASPISGAMVTTRIL